MRIAFLTDSYWPRVNGVTVSVQTYRDEFERRGHASIVICPEYPDAMERDEKTPGVLRFPSMASMISSEDRLVRLDAFPAVFRALGRFRPDLIYVQTEFTLQIAGRIYARSRRLPFICCAHTDFEHYIGYYVPQVQKEALQATARFIMRTIYDTADCVVTPSRSMERVLLSYGVRKPFHVVPTGVPLMFSPQRREDVAAYRSLIDARFPHLKGKRLLLFAGRVTEEKGVDFLLPMLERVLEQRDDVALLVAGDGPHRAIFETHASERNLSQRTAFMGYVPHDDLPIIYALSEIFVFPSKTETLGLCTIEAMATGTPVVAIGEMGTRDVMEGDNGGFMVPDDLGEFTAAVLRLLGDEGLRSSKSAEAVAWSKRYSIETTSETLLSLFAGFVKNRRRRNARRSLHRPSRAR